MDRSIQAGLSGQEMQDLLELARRHARTEFPNVDRVGCPDSALLGVIASGGSSPRELVFHVMHCSPCYGEYIRLQREARIWRGVRLGLAGLATAAALLIGLYFGRDRSEPQVGPAPKRSEEARVVPQEKVSVTVDLGQYAVLRGDGSNPVRRAARLPAKRLLVTFQMPLGVEAGIYRVRLTQQSGPVMEEKTVRAQFRTGVAFFELELDAEGLAGKRVTLWVQPNGLNWRQYPLIVDRPPPLEGGTERVEKKKE